MFYSHLLEKTALQSLSAYRWSVRHEAVQIFDRHFGEVIDTLIVLEEDPEENPITRKEAKVIGFQVARLQIVYQFFFDNLCKYFGIFCSINSMLSAKHCKKVILVMTISGLSKVWLIRGMNLKSTKIMLSKYQRYKITIFKKRKRKLRANESRDVQKFNCQIGVILELILSSSFLTILILNSEKDA